MLLDLLNEAPLAKTQILMPPRLIHGKSTARRIEAATLTASRRPQGCFRPSTV